MQLMPFIATFIIVGIAELGDKTQLLTLALASKYPMEKVISGIFSATAALMLIAVLLGEIILKLVPMLFISILSGAFFIIYGLYIIAPIKKEERDRAEKPVKSKDPFWVVFGSFFLAEVGDKTQLATFALSAKYGNPLQVWIGATLGMVLANIFGIVIGNVLQNYLPQKMIDYISGGIFILFGLITFFSILLKV